MAETDMFLKIDGIEGESQDHKFKEWIEVLSWSWSVHQGSTAHIGTGGGHSKASFSEIHISKHMDKASVKAFKACSRGDHIKKAKLVCRKAGGQNPLEYFSIEMEDVIITDVSFSGHGGGASQVSETLALSFGKFKEIYRPQSSSGSAENVVDWGFSIKTNTES